MTAPSALVGQLPMLLSVTPTTNSPAKAVSSPFQLDTSLNTPAAAPAPAKLQADTLVGALASIAQVLTLLATKSTATPLINANAGNGVNGAGGGPALLSNGGVTIPATFNTTTDPTQKAKLDVSLAKSPMTLKAPSCFKKQSPRDTP